VPRRELAVALRRYRPDFVLGFNYRDITVTGKWNTPDHRHTGRAWLDALGDAGNRWIFPDAGELWGTPGGDGRRDPDSRHARSSRAVAAGPSWS
jgi:LmbE family N-acetylglucosaminyl deacetylase